MKPGHLLKRQFYAKIAAGDHDTVAFGENIVDGPNRGPALDLRHDGCAALHDRLDVENILRALNKGNSNPIDARFDCSLAIFAILYGHGAKRQDGVRQITFPAGQDAARYDFGDHPAGLNLNDAQIQLPVIDQKRMPRLRCA